MGRLLQEKSIIENNIILHLRNSYGQHSKRLAGTPTFTEYFNKNVSASSQDQTLETVKEVIGFNSPLRYNRIEDFPIFMVNEVNPNLDLDEDFGLNLDASGEGIILPGTIKPFVDDFLNISYEGEKYLYRVTSVEPDKVNGQKYYKIQFTLSSYNKEDIEEQVEEDYISHYENIGTQDKAILTKADSIMVDLIDQLVTKLIDFYIRSFMSKKFNVLTYKYNDKIVYNEFLIRFLIDNKVLETSKKRLLKTYHILDIFPDSPAMYELYNTTLYSALAQNKLENFRFENMITMEIQKNYQDNPFSFDHREYYRVYYIRPNSHEDLIPEMDMSFENYKNSTDIILPYEDIFGKQNSGSYAWINEKESPYKQRHVLITPHNSQLIEKINNDELFDNNFEFYLENIIIKYFNNKLEVTEEFIEELFRKNFPPTFKEYLLLPCIIFMLKEAIKDLTNN